MRRRDFSKVKRIKLELAEMSTAELREIQVAVNRQIEWREAERKIREVENSGLIPL